MDICICPWTESHILFSISLCWYKGMAETQQTVQEVFILLERKSPCQRSMARLARITVIPNLQFLFSNSSWQVGAGFVPCEYYRSCNMKAGGKEGRRDFSWGAVAGKGFILRWRGTTWFFSSYGGILELRWGIQAASCVGPGKSNLPFDLRRKAGDCIRATAGPIDLI